MIISLALLGLLAMLVYLPQPIYEVPVFNWQSNKVGRRRGQKVRQWS